MRMGRGHWRINQRTELLHCLLVDDIYLFLPFFVYSKWARKGEKWRLLFLLNQVSVCIAFTFLQLKKISQEVRIFMVKVRNLYAHLKIHLWQNPRSRNVRSRERHTFKAFNTDWCKIFSRKVVAIHNPWDGMKVLRKQTPCLFIFVSSLSRTMFFPIDTCRIIWYFFFNQKSTQ